jgi:hypothetical protein
MIVADPGDMRHRHPGKLIFYVFNVGWERLDLKKNSVPFSAAFHAPDGGKFVTFDVHLDEDTPAAVRNDVIQ